MDELIQALTEYVKVLTANASVQKALKIADEVAVEENPVPAPKRGPKMRKTAEPAAEETTAVETKEPSEKETNQSTKDVMDIAKLLVSKFNKAQGDGKPEGFHIAKKLLIEDFKVGRLSDLSHEQRLAFVKQVKEILTKEPVGV